MKNVLIAGGNGFLGKQIADYFMAHGFAVSILSRNEAADSKLKTYTWNPSKGILNAEVLKDQDIIINLSGAGIAKKLWTSRRKNTLYNSRIHSTRVLVDSLLIHNLSPNLFINASAVGYYGDRPGERLTETSDKGVGFLSTLCSDWEKEVRRLDNSRIKYAILRIGIVLSNQGGSFPKLFLPVKMRLNLLFGKGRQNLSWIHIDDMVKIVYSIATGNLSPEIYNCVSPNTVSQKSFNEHLVKAAKVKSLQLSLPKKILSLIMGEMSEIFLSDLNVSPENLMKQNFQYAYPDLNASILHLLNNHRS